MWLVRVLKGSIGSLYSYVSGSKEQVAGAVVCRLLSCCL
jgi:hypothetical protein